VQLESSEFSERTNNIHLSSLSHRIPTNPWSHWEHGQKKRFPLAPVVDKSECKGRKQHSAHFTPEGWIKSIREGELTITSPKRRAHLFASAFTTLQADLHLSSFHISRFDR